MKFIFGNRKQRRRRTSTESSLGLEEAGSTRTTTSNSSKDRSKRRSLFRARRKETQDILAEPDQFLEKLLENGLFGPDMVSLLFVGIYVVSSSSGSNTTKLLTYPKICF